MLFSICMQLYLEESCDLIKGRFSMTVTCCVCLYVCVCISIGCKVFPGFLCHHLKTISLINFSHWIPLVNKCRQCFTYFGIGQLLYALIYLVPVCAMILRLYTPFLILLAVTWNAYLQNTVLNCARQVKFRTPARAHTLCFVFTSCPCVLTSLPGDGEKEFIF